MRCCQILALAALAWVEPLLAGPDDDDSLSVSGRNSGRVVLTDTAPSEILFDPPAYPATYTYGQQAANRLLGFVSEYGELGQSPPDLYEPNANVLLLFSDLFEQQLHSDPFYLFGEDPVRQDEFLYDEQAWNALGSALRRKYQIFRSADKAIRRVQEATTLSYQSRSGIGVRVRPAIEDIMDPEKIRMRIALLNVPLVHRVEAKIGQKDLRVSISQRAHLAGRLSVIQWAYEGRDGEEGDGRENIAELTMLIPFW